MACSRCIPVCAHPRALVRLLACRRVLHPRHGYCRCSVLLVGLPVYESVGQADRRTSPEQQPRCRGSAVASAWPTSCAVAANARVHRWAGLCSALQRKLIPAFQLADPRADVPRRHERTGIRGAALGERIGTNCWYDCSCLEG